MAYISTESEYKAALDEINSLIDIIPNTQRGERLEALIYLVEAYEENKLKSKASQG